MQAAIVTAYKDFSQLEQLVMALKNDFYIFIHVDSKSQDIGREQIRKLNKIDNVFAMSKYRVTWGGINHLYAVLDCMKEAVKTPNWTYVHIISGQDYPLKKADEFNALFCAQNETIYLTVADKQSFSRRVRLRLEHYFPFQNLEVPKLLIRTAFLLSVFVQKVFLVKRKQLGRFEKVYKGVIWSSLPRAAAQYALDRVDAEKSFLEDLRFSYIPEEFFFQTIFMNSAYKTHVFPRHLRYTDWKPRHGVKPAILDAADYDNVVSSGCFFARKFDSKKSKQLLDRIRETLI